MNVFRRIWVWGLFKGDKGSKIFWEVGDKKGRGI